MKLPIAKIIKIFVDEAYETYISVESARSEDSDGGRKVTRKEVWEIVISLLLRIGPKVEKAIFARNTDRIIANYRWKVLSIIAYSLTDLPDEFERAKRDDNEIDKAERREIIYNVLKNTIPEIFQSIESDIQ